MRRVRQEILQRLPAAVPPPRPARGQAGGQGGQVRNLRIRVSRGRPQPEEARQDEALGGRRGGGQEVPVLALLQVRLVKYIYSLFGSWV